MAEIIKKWYVLRTIGGKEKKVKEYIESEIANLGMTDYVSQVLIPTEKVFQIRNGKKVSKERNLFPGYIYLEERKKENQSAFMSVDLHPIYS